MRLDIRYTTQFRYSGPVTESQNELRASPVTDEHQWLVHYDVTTNPGSRVTSYTDYWGTRVDTFGVRLPHDALDVVATATVETADRPADPPAVTRDAYADNEFRDRNLEFLQPSPHVEWSTAVSDAALASQVDSTDMRDTIMAVHDRVAAMEYRSGLTQVGIHVDEILAAGSGVCQDFAHLTIAMYRQLGIPARYVSGYLFTANDATGEDTAADEVEVETHAWVEVAIPDWGWLALDPTNAQPVGERYVVIGRGRDYDDVSPFRGVYTGDQQHALDVNVTMRRLALQPTRDVQGGPGARSAQQ